MQGDLTYHFMVDNRGIQQVIALNGAEIFDCLEKDHLKAQAGKYPKRYIFKKFNANLIIKSDNSNNTNYTVSTSTL